MSHKLTGKSVDEAKELIRLLAKSQLEMEAEHYDTLRTIMRHVKQAFPDEPGIKYPTLAQWLKNERLQLILEKLK